VQRHQQRSLHEAQTQHQIEMKRRRQRIALIECLWNRAARLPQPGYRRWPRRLSVAGNTPKRASESAGTTAADPIGSASEESNPRSNCSSGRRWSRGCESNSAVPGRPANRALAAPRAERCATGGTHRASLGRSTGTALAGSSGLRAQREGVLLWP
jgi:hypothetical protein